MVGPSLPGQRSASEITSLYSLWGAGASEGETVAVIDIDTHFEPGRAWLKDHPKLADRLIPFDTAEATVRAQVGDLDRKSVV